MDQGEILYQKAIPILDEDTNATMFDKLAGLALDMLLEFLPKLFAVFSLLLSAAQAAQILRRSLSRTCSADARRKKPTPATSRKGNCPAPEYGNLPCTAAGSDG